MHLIYLWHLFGTNFQKVVVFFGVVCVYRYTHVQYTVHVF